MTQDSSWLGFDADGVVVDSRSLAWSVAADIVGLVRQRPTIESAADHARVFGREAQAQLLGADGAPTLRALHRLVMRARAAEVSRFDGVLDVIEQLSLRPPLVTAAYAQGVRRALGERAALFAQILGREAGGKAGLLADAAARGMSWYVCDTASDIRHCRSLGVKVVAVEWGYGSGPDLAAASPDICVSDPSALCDVLQQLASRAAKFPAKGAPS